MRAEHVAASADSMCASGVVPAAVMRANHTNACSTSPPFLHTANALEQWCASGGVPRSYMISSTESVAAISCKARHAVIACWYV